MTGEFVDEWQSIQALQGYATGTGLDELEAIAETQKLYGPNGVAGWAGTFFVGIPESGFNPSFYGPSAGPAPASQAGSYGVQVSAGSPPKMKTMANANKAICYFSFIAGAFRGGGEYAEMYVNGEGNWVLEVASEQDDGTEAGATCYAFDQSTSLTTR